MQLLSDEKAIDWCQHQGLIADGRVSSALIRFAGDYAIRLRLQIPEEPKAVVGLAYMVLMTGVPKYEEPNFNGALIWLQRWEIWSEQIDRAGYVLLDGIRAGSREPVAIASAPAQLFGEREFASAHACLALPMLFQWDAHFVPFGGDFLAFVSHEGDIDLISRDPQTHETLLQRFREWVLPNPLTSATEAG